MRFCTTTRARTSRRLHAIMRTSNFQMEYMYRDVGPSQNSEHRTQFGSTSQYVVPKAADLLGATDLVLSIKAEGDGMKGSATRPRVPSQSAAGADNLTWRGVQYTHALVASSTSLGLRDYRWKKRPAAGIETTVMRPKNEPRTRA